MSMHTAFYVGNYIFISSDTDKYTEGYHIIEECFGNENTLYGVYEGIDGGMVFLPNYSTVGLWIDEWNSGVYDIPKKFEDENLKKLDEYLTKKCINHQFKFGIIVYSA